MPSRPGKLDRSDVLSSTAVGVSFAGAWLAELIRARLTDTRGKGGGE